MSWVVMLSTLPVTLTTGEKFTPSVDTWILKAAVLLPKPSPPAPACSTTKRETLKTAPRSTVIQELATFEHHLSLSPPETLPLTAWAAVCEELHGVLLVVAPFSARFCGAGVEVLGPNTETNLDKDPTYVFPFATMGGLPLEKFRMSWSVPELDQSKFRFSALKA